MFAHNLRSVLWYLISATSNDSASKTKGIDNAATEAVSKKSNENSEGTKGASVKEDKDEPMDVDSSAEKDEKTKKPSETSGPATSAADSKPATKEPASVTAL